MKISATLSLCMYLGLYPIASAWSETPSAASLEALVSEYVQLQATLTQEQREWSEQKQRWASETKLLEAEKIKLEGELETRSQQEKDQAEEQAEIQARLATLTAALDALPPLLDKAETQLRSWRRVIPNPLLESIDHAFRDLPSDPESAGREDVMRRLQRVMGLYAQIEQMQSRIHVVKERLPTGTDERREVDVLYLGLARGFAVSSANDWAATGQPDGSDWRWDPAAELASSIRHAITIYNRQADAQFVALPFELTAEQAQRTHE